MRFVASCVVSSSTISVSIGVSLFLGLIIGTWTLLLIGIFMGRIFIGVRSWLSSTIPSAFGRTCGFAGIVRTSIGCLGIPSLGAIRLSSPAVLLVLIILLVLVLYVAIVRLFLLVICSFAVPGLLSLLLGSLLLLLSLMAVLLLILCHHPQLTT